MMDRIAVGVYVVTVLVLLCLMALAIFAPESVQLIDLRGTPDLR